MLRWARFLLLVPSPPSQLHVFPSSDTHREDLGEWWWVVRIASPGPTGFKYRDWVPPSKTTLRFVPRPLHPLECLVALAFTSPASLPALVGQALRGGCLRKLEKPAYLLLLSECLVSGQTWVLCFLASSCSLKPFCSFSTALTEPCQLPQCCYGASGLVWRPSSLPATL